MGNFEDYYERSKKIPPEPALWAAIRRLDPNLPKTVTDCGCGVGTDTEYLLGEGFEVDAFDADEQGVAIFRQRFASESKVRVECSTFLNYDYPKSSLINASLSLFFCPHDEFNAVWAKITNSIPVGGVFCGTFLGERDAWASRLICHTEEQVLNLFSGYQINQRRVSEWEEKRPEGHMEHRHSIHIVARKDRI